MEHVLKSTKSNVAKLVLRTCEMLIYPFAFLANKILNFYFGVKFFRLWGISPHPEWFDHDFDLFYFKKWRKPHFFERGVYVTEKLKSTDKVLDLCCGDGSVTSLFIAPMVKEVIGVDFDPSAIKVAQKRFSDYPNVKFEVGDIRKLSFADQAFDCVAWDAAIEHFTEAEINQLLGNIRRMLKPNGYLCGSTVQEKDEGLQHHDHEYEFESANQLKIFLEKFFPKVETWERSHNDRINIYFRASTN